MSSSRSPCWRAYRSAEDGSERENSRLGGATRRGKSVRASNRGRHYRVPGEGEKEKRLAMELGSASDLTLAEARKKAVDLVAQRNKGVDPVEERRPKRADDLA